MGGDKDLVLAVDVGTTEARASLFDTSGRLVGRATHAYAMSFPAPEQAEIAPDVLEQSMVAAIAALGPERRGAIALCVAAELGTVFLDAQARPLGDALCWPDKRAGRQAAELDGALGRAAVYETTGRVIDPELPACKLRWLRQTDPERAAATRFVVSIKDYLVYRLCGALVTDETHASYSMMFDVSARQWSTDLLAALEVEPSALPAVRSATDIAGELTTQAATRTGLCDSIPVAVGGPDGTVGTIGAGLVHAGRTVDLVGTADVVFHTVSSPLFDPGKRAVLNAHLVPGLWALGGPTGTTGGTLAQLAEMLGYGADSDGLAQLDAEAADVAPGADGLVCLTATAGERFPDWDSGTRGVLFGLRMTHVRAHVARAALEGGAYVLRSALDVYRDLGRAVDDVRIVGGGSRSSVWTQVRADVCATTMRPLRVREATALGAACLAMTGVGVFNDVTEACEHLLQTDHPVEPQTATSGTYQKLFDDYRKLRADLAATFRAQTATTEVRESSEHSTDGR